MVGGREVSLKGSPFPWEVTQEVCSLTIPPVNYSLSLVQTHKKENLIGIHSTCHLCWVKLSFQMPSLSTLMCLSLARQLVKYHFWVCLFGFYGTDLRRVDMAYSSKCKSSNCFVFWYKSAKIIHRVMSLLTKSSTRGGKDSPLKCMNRKAHFNQVESSLAPAILSKS